MPDLSLLELDPALKSIYKKVDGDDLFIFNEYHVFVPLCGIQP